jgi:hypothetical protein
MQTYDKEERFLHDWAKLSREQKKRFMDSVTEMVEDLRVGQGFRQGLRVKGVQRKRGVYEMTWAPDGRATFEIGKSLKDDEPHIIWRRIGGHDILDHP